MRLVLDTQVWLDWLVFDDKDAAPVRNAVALKRAQVFIDAACEAELERVLAYDLGKRKVDPAACLAQCRRLAHRFTNNLSREEKASLPKCRDPDDQKFLEAALAAGADILVTRDRALLELARRRTRPAPFRILGPGDATAALAPESAGTAPGKPRHRSPRR